MCAVGGEVDVERLVLGLIDERERLFDQRLADLPAVPVGQAGPWHGHDPAVERAGLQLRDLLRVAGDAVVLEEQVGRRLVSAEQNVGVVEPPLDRPGLHRLGEVRTPVGPRLEFAAEVEFAEQPRAIAGGLQQVADGLLAGQELGRLVPAPRAAGGASAPGVVAGGHRIPRRRAQRGRRVRVGEPHAFPRQPVNVGRGDFPLRVVALEIAPADVVGHDEDDVRARSLGVRRQGLAAERAEERDEKCRDGSHGILRVSWFRSG